MPTITLQRPHAGQADILRLRDRYLAIRSGRRFGKTALATTLLCDRAAHGERWGYFVPQYKLNAETYHEIYDRVRSIIIHASKTDGVIRLLGGGRIDFWTLNNENAGRSRKYHGVILDEVAFAGDAMRATWERAIKPTLLDYGGRALALSTPSGADSENWFFQICTQKEHGFAEYHAPTSANPHLPPEEIALLQSSNPPDVYRQEYLAEFVDWSGAAFFPIEWMLVEGRPVAAPTGTDVIFAVIDTAIKTGLEHNSTGVVYVAYNPLTRERPAVILDWDLLQIDSVQQGRWLDAVFVRCEQLAVSCGARRGSIGAFVEDKATGTVLIQQAANNKKPARAIDSVLTAMGKDERAIAASPYVYSGKIKIADSAFGKTIVSKGRSANHLVDQVTSYRLGTRQRDGLDLLDCFCYAVLIACGAGTGVGRGI